MQRRRFLGKRLFGEGTSSSGSPTKRSRSDQEVPALEDGPGSYQRSEDPARRPSQEILAQVPRYGTPVERNRVRTAGPYVLGHELGTSPGVPQTQYLARKQNTNEFYLLKILSYDIDADVTSKETQQGRTLLHTEYSILSLLTDLDGVIHRHGLFCDYGLEEKQIELEDHSFQWIYTGKLRRRLILVLDCVHAHEFNERSAAYVNLQKYVQTTRFSELEALTVFFEIVKVVEQLHQRNIIHRDLKLNNIVLNQRTNKIVITNFFLAKHLNNEDDPLYDQRGSPAYISPDVLGGKPYKGKPSDVWALGVILFTIIYGKFPFLDSTPAALFKKIRQADYTIPIENKASPLTIQLIKSMLTLNPTERFTASEVRAQVERTIMSLRGPRIDVDQVVPEIDFTEQTVPDMISSTPKSDRQDNARSNGAAFPSYALSQECFSQVLESSRRENESFIRPRSLVSRTSTSRNNLTSPNRSFGSRTAIWNQPNISPRQQSTDNTPTRNRPSPQINVNNGTASTMPHRAVASMQYRNVTYNVSVENTRDPLPPQRHPFLVQLETGPHHVIQLPGRIPGLPVPLPQAIPTSPAFQNPDIQALFSAMNEMFTRGRMPPPCVAEPPEFHGIITTEMANKIVAWLLANFRNHAIVQEIFGSTSGNKVNNVLELLRRFGVHMEVRAGQVIVKVEQTVDILMFLTYLMQVAGLNNNYFLNSI